MMTNIVSRLDITKIFCALDDFCQQIPQLPSLPGERRCSSRISLSEVMTIAIAFHGSGFGTFKEPTAVGNAAQVQNSEEVGNSSSSNRQKKIGNRDYVKPYLTILKNAVRP